jgi:hypothetical protein
LKPPQTGEALEVHGLARFAGPARITKRCTGRAVEVRPKRFVMVYTGKCLKTPGSYSALRDSKKIEQTSRACPPPNALSSYRTWGLIDQRPVASATSKSSSCNVSSASVTPVSSQNPTS